MMGEPFINKSLLTFVGDAKERGLSDKVIITSNGSLINPQIHKDLIASGLDYLRISIYGATEADQKKNTQTNTPISKIRDNVHGLFKLRNDMGSIKPYIYKDD
jgi:MoaA/NifB/PqqE/SkfB family radical SAM enzyme